MSYARHILNRLGYGPRPEEINAFNALGSTNTERLTTYLQQQLAPNNIDDSVLDAKIQEGNFVTLNKSVTELWQEYVRDVPELTNPASPLYDLERVTYLRAAYTKRQLFEITAQFWHEHFSVYGSQSVIRTMIPHYDRNVIRPHVFGNFRQLLEAVAKSTSMLYYLDNYTSSSAAPNENWARELFELHTMGKENYLGSALRQHEVDGHPDNPVGYVDDDVYEAARCFTGWTISNSATNIDIGDNGDFYYHAEWHDRFQKTVLGKFIAPDQANLQDGYDVLDRLCAHEGTARFISRKLCKWFVSDVPSDALVQAVATIFLENVSAPNQIAMMIQSIVLSDEFNQSLGTKIKRPFHATISALRGLSYDFSMNESDPFNSNLRSYTNATGARPYDWRSPDGYPNDTEYWLNTTSVFKRFRIYNFLTSYNIDDIFYFDVVSLQPQNINTSREIIDYWVDRIIGTSIPNEEHEALMEFFAQGYSYDLSFSMDDTNIQDRIRALVALICMNPSFQQR